ncbi:MAG: hypothetical protein ACI85O_001529 [Saprospiraceae bacterium]|jgi:hypothetical protein
MKTIQISLLTTLLIFCSQNTYAQSIFGASVVAGANIAQMTGDMDPGFNKIGIHGGIKASVRLGYRTEMGIGILYDQRGSRNRPRIGDEPFKIKIDYIMVPVTYSFKDWYDEDDGFYKVHFTGGLAYGRLFQSSQEGGAILNECLDDFRQNDVSWVLGASYFWTKHWGATIYHTRPLFNANTVLVNCVQDIRPYQWTFRVEYKF